MAASYNGGGKSDWFLPSLDELDTLNLQKTLVGGFVADKYWSSSEVDASNAMIQSFSTGYQYQHPKGHAIYYYVRPIRAF
jgi:hypothetical protein